MRPLSLIALVFVATCLHGHAGLIELDRVDATALVIENRVELEVTVAGRALAAGDRIWLVDGDVSLLSDAQGEGWSVGWDTQTRRYHLEAGPGQQAITATVRFLVRPTRAKAAENSRGLQVQLPPARLRQVSVQVGDAGMELTLHHVLGLTTTELPTGKQLSGILQPNQPFRAQWQNLVVADDVELLMTSHANSLISLQTGTLRLDSLYIYTITQGEMDHLSFFVPEGLNITQVRGPNLRDWSVQPHEGGRRLLVKLDKPQSTQYPLHIMGERILPDLPTTVAIPVLRPLDGNRADGYLAVGTDSAIQLQVAESRGLAQIDRSAFQQIPLDRTNPRQVTSGSTFFFTFAATPWDLQLKLADVVPVYDVEQRLAVLVQDDELAVVATLELDVRDAPIRRVQIWLPAWLTVAAVGGKQVADHQIDKTSSGEPGMQQLVVEFKDAAIGPVLIELKLELGRSPLDNDLSMDAIRVVGARNSRGFIAVAAAEGVLLDLPVASGLRDVNTRAIPMRVPGAEFAYRFREEDWRLELHARRKPASIRAEAFQLLSIGDGVVYGSAVLSYHIEGAPVDELRFRIAPELANVEFVGMDVARWSEANGIWTVTLRRKTTGAYNLGVTWIQRYESGGAIVAGGVACEGVETQTGFVTLASHLSLETAPGTSSDGLFAISHEEIPEQYRLLVNAPIIASYKYVGAPVSTPHTVSTYNRGTTPTALVEYMTVGTDLSINEDGVAESVTIVRYTLKNSSAQFLDLRLPADITVWAVRLIATDGSAERLTASRVGDLLKIPTPRRRNPNEPITLELEFGQTHGNLNMAGDVELRLPESLMMTTYSDWEIRVPDGWHVASAGPHEVPYRRIVAHVGNGWQRAFAGLPILGLLAAFGVIVLGVGLAKSRRNLALCGLAFLALALAGLGAAAWSNATPLPVLGDGQTQVAQVLTLDGAQTPIADIQVRPIWRASVQAVNSILFILLAILGGIAGWRSRRWRVVGATTAVTAAALFICQFQWGMTAVAVAMTWLLPVIVLGLLVGKLLITFGRRLKRPPSGPSVAGPEAVVTTLVLLLGITLSANAAPVLDRCDVAIDFGKDSALVHVTLTAGGDAAGRYHVGPPDAVVVDAPSDPAARLTRLETGYWLEMPPSVRSVKLSLLYPLAQVDDRRRASIAIVMPPRLRNRVTATIPQTDIDVLVGAALDMQTAEADGATTVSLVLPPEEPLRLEWRPRARQTSQERTLVYAEVASIARLDTGLVDIRHRLKLRIAQGELSELAVTFAPGVTVSSVDGELLRSWRFDPDSGMLILQTTRPLSGDYVVYVRAQSAVANMPYTIDLAALGLPWAEHQRHILGVVTSSDVVASVATHPTPMNLDDYVRQAGDLLGPEGARLSPEHAFMVEAGGQVVQVQAGPVIPEIRVVEQSSFSVADDRLVLGSQFQVMIAKTGVFHIDLVLPADYDVDALTGEGVSHWTDLDTDGERRVRVHLDGRRRGTVVLAQTLSRPLQTMPDVIDAPRVAVVGALKHTGNLVVSVERGLRLGIHERDGISELDVARLNLRDKPALAFKLLRPDWRLRLVADVVEPRINVDYLHLAQVSDGLIRHRQFLRYNLHNAGIRELHVIVPPDALGLMIAGPEIARKEAVDPTTGLWRIELTGKWFDRTYPLEITYTTRFDPDLGTLSLVPVKARDADLQRGYIAVRGSTRVELRAMAVSTDLQPAEARTVPTEFGAGELADAVFCFATSGTDYSLDLVATRHEAADLLKAEVLKTTIRTVVNTRGDTLHAVSLTMRAGEKRYLHTVLPAGAQVWSLLVDRQSRTPSSTSNPAGERVLLIPLPQSTESDLTVQVDLVYAIAGTGVIPERFPGPRFDLPLRHITWSFHLPEGVRYDDFAGTLRAVESTVESQQVNDFSLSEYFADNQWQSANDLEYAIELQSKGKAYAESGNPQAARLAYNQAYNYSLNDRALNADARVNLRNLMQEQALVGLVQRRGYLDADRQVDEQDGANFTREEADRLRRSLTQGDGENLAAIAARIIELQEAAAGTTVQLLVSMPSDGRLLVFSGDMQVEPGAQMEVRMSAQDAAILPGGVWSAGLLSILGLTLIVYAGRQLAARLSLTAKEAI